MPVPHVRRPQFRPPDKRILEFLGLSRYITADQALALLGSTDPWVANIHRRLTRLTLPSRRRRDPLLQRFPLRRDNLSPLSVWTTTDSGWAEVERLVPYVSSAPPAPLGWQAMEHHIALTNVLVALIIHYGPDPTFSVLDLPFRWHPDSDSQIDFKIYDKNSGGLVSTAIKPDATIEIPERRRRLFLELEIGTNSITTDRPFAFNPGAITRKLERYSAFFSGLVELQANTTWYTKRYSDAFAPEILFLVHSTGRKERVSYIIEKMLGGALTPRPFTCRVITLDEAPAHLMALIDARKPPTSRVLTVPESVATSIRDGYDVTVNTLNQLLKAIDAHNTRHPSAKIALPAIPRDAIRQLAETIKHDLLGETRTPVKWAAHMVDEKPPSKRATNAP